MVVTVLTDAFRVSLLLLGVGVVISKLQRRKRFGVLLDLALRGGSVRT